MSQSEVLGGGSDGVDDGGNANHLSTKQDVLINLGKSLTNRVKYLYDHQGLTVLDIIWVLHGVINQVVSWGFTEQITRELESQEDDDDGDDELEPDDDEDSDEGEALSDGPVIPKPGVGWKPQDDIDDPNDPDGEDDIDANGDPLQPA